MDVHNFPQPPPPPPMPSQPERVKMEREAMDATKKLPLPEPYVAIDKAASPLLTGGRRNETPPITNIPKNRLSPNAGEKSAGLGAHRNIFSSNTALPRTMPGADKGTLSQIHSSASNTSHVVAQRGLTPGARTGRSPIPAKFPRVASEEKTLSTHSKRTRGSVSSRTDALRNRLPKTTGKTPTAAIGGRNRKLEEKISKNLEGLQSSNKTAKLALDKAVFAKERKDVHAGRVFNFKKTQRTNDPETAKAEPSDWYLKTNSADFEFVAAPIYSVFVPGSPEVRTAVAYHEYDTGGKGEFQFPAYKGVKGARHPTSEEIENGSLTGMANSALMAYLAGYRDRRPGNCLVDEHNRFVLIDYEMNFEAVKDWGPFFNNPMSVLNSFTGHPSALDAFAQTEKFKQEMTSAMLFLYVFPSSLLSDPINSRLDHLAPGMARSNLSPLNPLIEGQSRFRQQIDKNGGDWKQSMQNLARSGSPEEVADQLIKGMAGSTFIRELDYTQLRNAMIDNIRKLQSVS